MFVEYIVNYKVVYHGNKKNVVDDKNLVAIVIPSSDMVEPQSCILILIIMSLYLCTINLH
jgi:hypothetical protein